MSQCIKRLPFPSTLILFPMFVHDTSNPSAAQAQHRHPLSIYEPPLPPVLQQMGQRKERLELQSPGQGYNNTQNILPLVCSWRHSSDLIIFLLKIHYDCLHDP